LAARNQIGESVQALLAERQVGPGDRLPPERQLAAELGVSRSALREGLSRLIDLGILETRQGSGTYAAPLDLDDLLGARLQLEPYAARLAARRRGEGDLARLDGALADLRSAQPDPEAFAAADTHLHQAVIDAADSLALRVLLAALADLMRRSRDTTASDPAVRAATLAELERLVEAIRAGDAAGAERAMRAHLRDIGAALAARAD
jgi:GntR family transcriptional repressor for pyruvate dehydrogenase complex